MRYNVTRKFAIWWLFVSWLWKVAAVELSCLLFSEGGVHVLELDCLARSFMKVCCSMSFLMIAFEGDDCKKQTECERQRASIQPGDVLQRLRLGVCLCVHVPGGNVLLRIWLLGGSYIICLLTVPSFWTWNAMWNLVIAVWILFWTEEAGTIELIRPFEPWNLLRLRGAP